MVRSRKTILPGESGMIEMSRYAENATAGRSGHDSGRPGVEGRGPAGSGTDTGAPGRPGLGGGLRTGLPVGVVDGGSLGGESSSCALIPPMMNRTHFLTTLNSDLLCSLISGVQDMSRASVQAANPRNY